jgi:hypothetical protein
MSDSNTLGKDKTMEMYLIAALPPLTAWAICALYEFGQRTPRNTPEKQQQIAARVIARRQKISGNRPRTTTNKGQ